MHNNASTAEPPDVRVLLGEKGGIAKGCDIDFSILIVA
jgi:hypothetical protein